MRRTSKASTAGSTSGSGKSRGLFGLACLCVLGLAAYLGSSAPSVGAAESFPGQGFLPDNRAWEMVSPPDKNGGDITGNATKTRAAADGDAATFLSLAAFGDAIGTGVGTEYMAVRSQATDPGDNGWATHAITPVQDAITAFVIASGFDLAYQGAFSDDLDSGVFHAWSPLSEEPNVAEVDNLYLREDLRTPGQGSYQLLSACPECSEPISSAFKITKPRFAGASQDFGNLIFEAYLNLTEDAPPQAGFFCLLIGPVGHGCQPRLYESDQGATRLAGVLPGGRGAIRSIAGRGVLDSNQQPRLTSRPISSDGRRIVFAVSSENDNPAGGLYSRIDGETTIQLNASERAVPDTPEQAEYWNAATDHSRVFLTSEEALTEDAPLAGGKKLYMWERAESDEAQEVSVDASGGSFTLILPVQPATFTGDTSSSSSPNVVESVNVKSGALSVGQAVSGPGIPAGTTVAAMGDFSESNTVTLSANATATGSAQPLTAIYNAKTPALPFDASAAQVQSALEGLAPIGTGNVTVTGGPGSAGGATPYEVAFTGALAGVNTAQLIVDSTALTGGAATASVATTTAVTNLSYLNVDGETAGDANNNVKGVIGASEDGHYVYFAATGQLVAGKPILEDEVGLYLWHEGTITYIGKSVKFSGDQSLMLDGVISLTLRLKQTRVAPDGRHLLFMTQNGEGLLSAYGDSDYNHNNHLQLYLYSADTNELACVSCNPHAPVAGDAVAQEKWVSGAAELAETYLNHPLADDGSHVFFSTQEALDPNDLNGRWDAYLYDTAEGKARLISSGESGADSYFMDASRDGKDAFFITREQLSGWDVDSAYDLYDARVGGGFPEPQLAPPSCQGDACQPAPLQLNDPTPSSSSASGPGNAAEHRKARARCPRGKHRVRTRSGRTRCVKRQSGRRNRKHARDAKNDWRASR